MSLSFVLAGSQIKRFRSSLRSLAAIGSELLVEGIPERLVLRAINSARSAFLAVTFSANFFESYNVFGETALVQAGVLIKHLLATLRTARVSTMSCELKPQEGALRVTIKCENGLIKRYGLDINDAEILQANLDGQDLPVTVVAEAAELNKLLNTFQSTLDEITIIAQPEQQPQDSTAAAVAAAQRAVQMQSFYDPAKGLSSQSLHTSLQLDSHSVFKSYSHQGNEPSDVTVNLKDLKALVALCVDLGVDVSLKFDSPGVPLLAVPHVARGQEMDYTAELILATLQESQLNDQEHWGEEITAAAGDAPAAAAAASDGFTTRDNTNRAAASSRPETIAPATTYTTGLGGAAAAAAAAAGDTPQGRLNPNHARHADSTSTGGGFNNANNKNPFTDQQQQWQQQQQWAAAAAAEHIPAQSGRLGGLAVGIRPAAAAAAGGSGGVSGGGGRSRSGGGSGLSRLQRLEAEEEMGRLGDVAPYSRLESSLAAAGRSAGGREGTAAAAAVSGPAAAVSGGMRSPTGMSRPDSWRHEAAAALADAGTDSQHQQQQQEQQPEMFASRSLGEFARQQQQWGEVNTGVADVVLDDGTDSQMDPETLPGNRGNVRRVFQQHMQVHLQQQQQQQPQAFGSEQLVEQQQQQQDGDGDVAGGDSDEELPETPSDEQQKDGAGFGFL